MIIEGMPILMLCISKIFMRVVLQDSASTQNRKVLDSNPTDMLGRALGHNLVEGLPVESDECSDLHWVSLVASSLVVRS